MSPEGSPLESSSNYARPSEASLLADGGTDTDTQILLPPENATPSRILALPGSIIQRYHADTITALVGDTNPDAIVATSPSANSAVPFLRHQFDQPILRPGYGTQLDVTTVNDDTMLIIATPDGTRSLTETSADDQELSDVDHRCVVTDALSLSVDPYDRSATVEGFDEYSNQFPTEWSHENTTHLSTALRAGFTTTLDVPAATTSATVVGIGDSTAELGVGRDSTDTDAALIDVYRNGAVSTETLDPERFGLRSLSQVGQQRAETLRHAGFNTSATIAEADTVEIADLDGVGTASATTIHSAATAVDTRSVVPTGDDPLPNGDPVFIDIETDGRNPSTAWLIGVLDGDSETGDYLAFREEHPGDGAHLEAFMMWLTGSAAGRPVVAWHGYNFDFPVIEDQLRQHCPEHLAAWNDTYCFDALYWARDKNGGNAALPGRTNKLEGVARALGWEPSTTGIDGGTVAEVYTAWRTRYEQASDPHSVTQPPWERLERYCEDDVRALATIYDALRDAARRDPDSSIKSTGEDSTQGALSDFT